MRKGVNKVALRLFEHNEKAYHAAVRMMEQFGKAAIVHPTGTGKSYIAFKLIEDNPEKVVIWLSPSEYIFKTQLESLKRNDPDFPLANVHFYTYAKLVCCTQAQLDEIAAQKPAYIILDEFHRAGAECWGESAVALLKLCPNAKLLGLTATNIRYLDNNRNMDEELFNGHIASEMTLGEAVVRGILPAPKYVTTVYQYQKKLAKYQARVDNLRASGIQDANQKYLDALHRALEQADGLDRVFAHHITNKCGKYIVFCANKEHMDEMVSHVPEWFAGVNPNAVVYQAYSDDPNTDRAFADFKTDMTKRLKLLFCIDMLNEGVHVESISGVVRFRPTISPIIYKQQIQRLDDIGMVWGNRNEIAWQRGLESAQKYHETHGNLMVPGKYIDPEGYPLGQWIIKTRQQRLNDRLKEERITQLDEIGMVWSVFDVKWEKAFVLAAAYYEQNGNLNMPRSYVTAAGEKLGYWVANQQWTYQKGKLSDDQIMRLERIGMYWGNRNDRQWNEGYQETKCYFDAHGDLKVPADYVSPDGYALGKWVKRQRYTRHNPEKSCAVLTAERIAKLDAIGMRWEKSNPKHSSGQAAQAETVTAKAG